MWYLLLRLLLASFPCSVKFWQILLGHLFAQKARKLSDFSFHMPNSASAAVEGNKGFKGKPISTYLKTVKSLFAKSLLSSYLKNVCVNWTVFSAFFSFL